MEATASIGCQSRELSLLRLRRCSDGHTAYEWVMAMGEAESASAAAPACSSACSVEKDDDAPRTRTYLDESEAVFDRLTGAEHLVTHIDDGGGAAAWDESQRGQRELRFRLVSHRQRWAHKLWPAAQVLARHLDANPWLARSRPVLEIGAGAALPSVVAGLLGASAVVVSDWPDAKMLENMRHNLAANLPSEAVRQRTRVVGYDWNRSPAPLLDTLSELLPPALPAPPLKEAPTDARGAAAAAAASPSSRFELILLSDLLYECEHESILRAVSACLGTAGRAERRAEEEEEEVVLGEEESRRAGEQCTRRSSPCALLTFQCHDRCQLARQLAFFELAPRYGLQPRRLALVDVGKAFDDSSEDDLDADGEEEEEGPTDGVDVTHQVQLWQLVPVPARPGAPRPRASA